MKAQHFLFAILSIPRRNIGRTILPCFICCFISSLSSINGYGQENVKENTESEQQRGNTLMERVFLYGEKEKTNNLQFNSNVYIRHRMYTKRNGQIVRYIPGMLRLESGSHDYLSEAQLKIQYRQPSETDCKIIAYCSTSRYQSSSRLNGMGRFIFFLYGSKLFTDRILNPLNRRNKRFYHYSYKYTSKSSNSDTPVARIHVIPCFKNDQLIEGDIDIDYTTGAIRNFIFRMRYNLCKLTVTGRMGEGSYESLVPEKMRIISHFKLFGNIVHEVIEIRSKHTFSCPPSPTATDSISPYDLTRLCLLRIDTTSVITSPQHFDSIRPYPLRTVEKELLNRYYKLKYKEKYPIIQKTDTTNDAHHLPSLANHTITKQTKKNNRFLNEQTINILFNSHTFNISDNQNANVKLPPIIAPSMIQWSHTKGLSLRTRIRCNFFSLPNDNSPRILFNPSIGYSFKQKQLYYDIPVTLRFSPSINGQINIIAGGGAHIYNNLQAKELRESFQGVEKYDSLIQIISRYGFHDYRDNYLRTDFSLSPIHGITLKIGSRFHRRVLIDWNDLAKKNGLDHRYTTLGPRLEIEWTPAQYYYKQQTRRLPLYSHWPTFIFCYERGFGFGEGETHYERIETDIRYRIPLYAMRTLFFRVGSGFYIQRGKDSFLDYDYFKFDYMPAGWNDELTGEIQLLSSRWYNESRYYLRFTSTYESPMLLFSRIPFLSQFIQKERTYLNILSVKSLGFYSEVGYGISTHLLDVGTFFGISSSHTVDVGCKFVFRFFDS